MIRVFKRKTWRKDPARPGKYLPGGTRRTTVRMVGTEQEAIDICQAANAGRPTEGTAYYEFVWTEWERA